MDKPKKWTIEELKNAVVNAESINRYYKTVDDAFDVIIDRKTPELPGESWRKCNNHRYHTYEIHASNRGRIKVIKDGEETICELCEEIAPEKPITSELFKSLIKRGEKHIGWLKAKIPGNKRCLGPYVYQMVADAWLADKCGPEMEIHHITNDGYDNRPENLTILKKSEHKKIQHYGLPEPRYYPGIRDKK